LLRWSHALRSDQDVSPGFWRVQAAKISFNTSTLLLMNSYFPTDPQRDNVDESDLLETLGHIKKAIDMNPCDAVLWAGDLNSDFTRRSSHTLAVQDVFEELGLQSSWDKFDRRDNAYFWHQIWDSCGRPINTQVHNIMKRTRNIYHYHYKKCKKAEEQIKRSKLLSACLGEGGDLFEEIKALRKAPAVVATSIDGVSENVPDHFGKIYSDLYNSADDATELMLVHERVEALVNCSHLDTVQKITPELVMKAVSKLKPGKSDPVYSFSSDCFKSATMNLHTFLLS
jgi:hypothetical protein